MWHLEKIPKILNTYWGNSKLPYLRLLTIRSFVHHNPDWTVRLYYPKIIYDGPMRDSKSEDFEFTGKDYWKDVPESVEQIEIDFDDIIDTSLLEECQHGHITSFKAGFTRQHLLSTTGGFWSDMDIIYLKPMLSLVLNTPENAHLDTLVCIGSRLHSVAFMGTSPANEYAQYTFKKAQRRFQPGVYQAIGVKIVNDEFPAMKFIKKKFPNLHVGNIPMDVVYPYDTGTFEEIFESEDVCRITKNSIGLHWYAGHKLAKSYINLDKKALCATRNVLGQVALATEKRQANTLL